MRFVTDYECLLSGVKELAARTAVREHLVAKVLEQSLEVVPLEVGRRRAGAQLFEGLLVLGHAAYIRLRDSVTAE